MFSLLLVLPILKWDLYEIFAKTHRGIALFLLYAIWRHTKNIGNCKWYTIACIALFAATLLLQTARIIYRNVVFGRKSVQLTIIPAQNSLIAELTLPRPWKFQAGERINLTVPLGLLSLFQTHPFVITWWEDHAGGNGGSIFLLIRPRSGFTKKLETHVEPGKQYSALIDGPYGPSPIRLLGFPSQIGDYGHIFMAATGVGIAAQIPYIKELIEGRKRGQVRTQRIVLVWQLELPGRCQALTAYGRF